MINQTEGVFHYDGGVGQNLFKKLLHGRFTQERQYYKDVDSFDNFIPINH